MYNKKAQVSDTLSWIIATIIIVVMLLLFVFGSSLLSETKRIVGYKDSVFSEGISLTDNLYLSKSLYTFHQAKGSRNIVVLYDLIGKTLEGNSTEVLTERNEQIKTRLGK